MADNHPDTAHTCIACGKPVRDGDAYYEDVNEGAMHAECCGPEPESFTGADGEPLKPGDPIPAPGIYRGFEAPLSTAHTATAGDGGLRVALDNLDWLRLLIEPHAKGVAQKAFPAGVALQQVNAALAALAQAPAVQAPAGEDIFGDFDEANYKPDFASAIAAEIMGLTWTHAPSVGEDGGDGEQMHRYGDVQEAVSRVLEAARTKTHSVHLGKGPVPAQPNRAQPVGEEALREAMTRVVGCFDALVLSPPLGGPPPGYDPEIQGLINAHHRDPDTGQVCGGTVRPSDIEVLRTALASHPTTGQETVATPRDSGVREEAAENEDAYIARVLAMSSDEIRAEAKAVGVELPEPRSLPTSLRNLRFRLESALANRLEEGDREAIAWLNDGVISVGAALAALSAPSIAGPGEARENGLLATLPPKIVSACENEALNLANLWTNGNEGARTCILAALLRAHASYTTPTTVQPNTGDTGEPDPFPPGTPVEKSGGEYLFPGTVVASFLKLGGQRRYVVEDDRQSLHIFSAANLRLTTSTPATTAETRGPAEGVR